MVKHLNFFTWSFLLALLVALVFSGSLRNQFTNWDDDKVVLANSDIRSLSPSHIIKIWTNFTEGGYQPLTQMSFALDYALGQYQPMFYHLTSLFWHVINAILVMGLFMALGLEALPSLVMAFIWAIHPLRVESVCWISERKDLLFACFGLLSIWSFWVRQWFLSWVFLILSCLSKHQAAMIAGIWPCLDIYGGRKTDWRLYAIGMFTGVGILLITVINAKSGWSNMEMFSIFDKGILVIWTWLLYLIKSIYPFSLCVLYPYPAKVNGFFPLYVYGAIPVFIMIWTLAILVRRQCPPFLFALAWMSIHIALPLTTIVVGGYMMNDRYTYLSSVGIWFLIGWIWQIVFMKSVKIYRRAVGWLLAGIFILSFALMNISRQDVWYDGISLWSDAIKQYPQFSRIYENRATAYGLAGQDDLAMQDLNKSILLDPLFASAYNNRAIIKDRQGRFTEALQDWNKAILIDPTYGQAYFNRAIFHDQHGQFNQAWDDLMRAKALGIMIPMDYEIRLKQQRGLSQ